MVLPKHLKKNIEKEIKEREAEDYVVLKGIEKIFYRERGSIFKIPKSGSSVISLFSGGIDTTVVTSILIKEYGLNVFPLYIDRGLLTARKNRKAMMSMVNFFRKRYGKSFNNPMIVREDIPPKVFKETLYKAENDMWDRGELRRGIPLQPSMYASYAYYYSTYLEKKHRIKIRSIFGAWLYRNSDWYPYESLTSLRTTMLNLCNQDGDFSWQFTSLPMEKEMGFWWTKADLVKIGTEYGIPLEKTWTCIQAKRLQCGVCPTCGTRITAYKEAHLNDPTKYLLRKRGFGIRKFISKNCVGLGDLSTGWCFRSSGKEESKKGFKKICR